MSTAPSLTPRQLEVAALVAKGLPNADIAALLGCSVDTIKTHIRAIAEVIPDGRNLTAKYRILLYYREHPLDNVA